ncbi:MAG: F0F1 ATP synthase subunit A, partial [Oscillospiraceae bacterium]|nr:F0F1 ATP synthase subunit A [Oscillospiraceae bacterium]
MDLAINGARVLFEIENVPLLGTVQITQTLTVSWLVFAIITGLCIWLGSNLKVTGISRKQAVAEMIVGALVNFVRGNMGSEFDHYIPLVGTIFITSIISNLISLLGIWSPTADLMTELAWALVVFVLITYHKIKSSGIGGYLKGFLDPIFVMAPINVMSECFTPISMACRHFGNILSGTVISALIYGALTVANDALFNAIGASLTVAIVVAVAGAALFLVGKKSGKKLALVIGIIAAILGVL